MILKVAVYKINHRLAHGLNPAYRLLRGNLDLQDD